MRPLLTILSIFTILFLAAANLSAQTIPRPQPATILPRPQMIQSTSSGNGYQSASLFNKNRLAMKAISSSYKDNSPKSLNKGIRRSERNAMKRRQQGIDNALTYHPGGHDLTKSYYNGKDSAHVKDFEYYQKYNTKSFDAKKFDSHSFWTGNFLHRSKTASDSTKQFVSKGFDTKTMSVKTAPEASMTHKTREFVSREYLKQGREQASLNHPGDREGAAGPHSINDVDRAAFHPLSVNDVRELLNKMPNRR